MKRDGDPAAGQTSAALVDGNRVIAVRDLDKRDGSADVLDLIERPLHNDEVEALRALPGTPLATTSLLPPIVRPPKNILCVGKNYQEHVGEGRAPRAPPMCRHRNTRSGSLRHTPR